MRARGQGRPARRQRRAGRRARRARRRAVAAGVITADEARALADASRARRARDRASTTSTATSAHRCCVPAHRGAASEQAAPAQARARVARRQARCHDEPIYIVDGARTPFLKARNRPGPFAASDLATDAGRALLLRQRVRARRSSTRSSSAARRRRPTRSTSAASRRCAWAAAQKVPGWTVMRNCASGMQSIDSAINNIRAGRSQPRARRRRRCAVARAAPVLRRDGGVAVEVVCGEERRASARRCSRSSARATSRR